MQKYNLFRNKLLFSKFFILLTLQLAVHIQQAQKPNLCVLFQNRHSIFLIQCYLLDDEVLDDDDGVDEDDERR